MNVFYQTKKFNISMRIYRNNKKIYPNKKYFYLNKKINILDNKNNGRDTREDHSWKVLKIKRMRNKIKTMLNIFIDIYVVNFLNKKEINSSKNVLHWLQLLKLLN